MYIAVQLLDQLTVEQVTTLDLSDTPLEQLKLLIEKIYLPILSSPANQKGLPKLTANEVVQQLHRSVSDSKCCSLHFLLIAELLCNMLQFQ